MQRPRTRRRALAALALSLALIQPVPGLAAGQHVVKSGETLSEIADRYGISVQKLMQLNGIKDADLVEAGTKLKLPDGAKTAPRAGSGSSGAGSHTVSAGETLSEIAELYGLSVQKLMELNGLKDADLVQVGQRLKVPTAKSAAKPAKPAAPSAAGAKTARVHVVKSGETLSEISESSNVPVARLVSLNKLESPDNLQVGTKLSLGPASGTPAAKPAAPKPAAAKPTAAKPAAAKPAPAKPEPKPAPNPPEQAEQPAPAVATPAAQATPEPEAKPAATAAADPKPAAAKPATAKPTAANPPAAAPKPTVAAAKPQPKPDPNNAAPPDWRTYGPLQVDFSNWRPMGGSQVAPALNSSGQPVFLAINCAARKINATGEAGAWTSWEDPTTDFEEQLIKDVCKRPAS